MEDAPIAQPKKRSLFTRKIRAEPAVITEDGVDFFSKAKDLFPNKLVEEEQRRQRKQQKLERKRSTPSAEPQLESPQDKRRRVSSHSVDGEGAEQAHANSVVSSPQNARSSKGVQSKTVASPTTLSGRYSRDLGKRKAELAKESMESDDEVKETRSTHLARAQSSDPICIDDDDDDVFAVASPQKGISNRKVESQIIEDDSEGDGENGEFAILMAKARERARLKNLERESAGSSFTEKNHGVTDTDDIFQDKTKSEADMLVDVFVTSDIPDTTPLIVKRKLDQPLKPVRKAWSDKFKNAGVITPEMADSIFLTWKQKRVFDVTTCASLCRKPGDGADLINHELDEHGRLHLEAWTEELLTAHLLRQSQPSPEPAEKVREPKLKVTLKDSKGGKPLNMSVKASTMIQQMIDQYRGKNSLSESQDISLRFEGDILDPDATVEETELGEDMDCGEILQVEVHVR